MRRSHSTVGQARRARTCLSVCLLCVLLALLGACSRSEPEARAPGPTPAAATTTRVPATLGAAPVAQEGRAPAAPFVRPAARRVVAVGDLHGDLDATRRALRLAGVLDERDQWSGGDTVVVQTGDILDRGDDERAIIELTDRLRVSAPASGGAFIALSGNHELMNVAQDFRYVTPGGFSGFASEGGRDVAFRPAGSFARRLAERPVVVQVGDTVFVHGGVLPKHVAYGVQRLNDEVRAWMLGERPEPPAIMVAEDGPIWTREYSADTNSQDCAVLQQALESLGAKRMVVGHTPQRQGINAACDGRVWRIDVGMSRHYGGPIEVLQIEGDQVQVQREAQEPARRRDE
ncbi:MAG: Protein-tyrosine-phosphatase [Myxococcaceae bacterium]|nr:Protein-tyrosine-phosphatase [Myxococcaceae bacterium]